MNRKLIIGAMALLGAVAISAPAWAYHHERHHHRQHSPYWHNWGGQYGTAVAAGGGFIRRGMSRPNRLAG
jgi:hypothetical protein